MVRVLLVLTIFKALGFGSAVRIGENETLTRAALGCPDGIIGNFEGKFDNNGRPGRKVLCCKLIQGKCVYNPALIQYNMHDVENSPCGQESEEGCGALSTWQGCSKPGSCEAQQRRVRAEQAQIAKEVAERKKKEEAERKAAEEKAAKKEAAEREAREKKRAKEKAEREAAEAAKKEQFLKDNCKPHSNIECSSWTAKNAMSKYGTENNGCPNKDHVFCNTKAKIEGKYVCSCSNETKCFDQEAPDGNFCLVKDDFYGKHEPQ